MERPALVGPFHRINTGESLLTRTEGMHSEECGPSVGKHPAAYVFEHDTSTG
ncbi:hypothetical protein [Arthrobacter sp. DR-2P]|nr:hypothetical protein [Arthrobacter sp. DR-2P]